MRASRGFAIALAAAIAATAGDLALLLVSTAPHFSLTVPVPFAVLALGALLGIVGIPLYALGYAASARSVCAHAPRAALIVRLAGALASGIGAVIHAATAVVIHTQLSSGPSAGPAMEPIEAVSLSPALVALWSAAGVCFVLASAPLLWLGLRGPHRWALANPLVGTLALLVLGGAFELGRWFLMPAAPNLAHVVFFALGARAAGEHRAASR